MSSAIVSLFSVKSTDAKPPAIPVGQLVQQVRQTVESGYRYVRVIGEISSFKPWRSGHWYFDLKDEQAVLPSIMFRALAEKVRFEVKDGLQVILTGRVSVYTPQSKIQLIVDDIEPAGIGALQLAFLQLKERLEKEGLFDAKFKKPLPYLPKVIGLVTSPQGAVLKDMLRILNQRWPGVCVLIAPSRVQGEGAGAELADALRRLDSSGHCDVIILGRGGGSLEDLWAFNEEPLARAIFACQTPIISAVGHETDFTIADFVADLRCATPSHAAQTVVPVIAEVLQGLSDKSLRMQRQMNLIVSRARLRLTQIASKLPPPHVLILQRAQRVEELLKRLNKASPSAKAQAYGHKLGLLNARLLTQINIKLERAKKLLAIQSRALLALSPLQVLARGYAISFVERGGEKLVVTNASDVKVDDYLEIRLSQGSIGAQVRQINGKNPE